MFGSEKCEKNKSYKKIIGNLIRKFLENFFVKKVYKIFRPKHYWVSKILNDFYTKMYRIKF